MSLISITNQQRYNIGYRANIAANLTQRFVNNTKTLTAEQAAPIDAAITQLLTALVDAGYTAVPEGSAIVADGDSIDVLNLNGTVTTAATVEVDTDLGTAQVRFPATAAVLQNDNDVQIRNSAGTPIDNATFTVSSGVITYGTLPATVAGVANGATLTGVPPTGTYTDTVTFTVAGGVITGIALS